jgi:hypothetical protein
MSGPGSHERAAEVATRAILALGATNLQAKLAGHYAARGSECWETDRACVEANDVRRPDGRRYHKGSAARARRGMKSLGWIDYKRILPTERLPTGRRSSQGTTNKWIDWAKLRVRNPLTRRENREAKKRQDYGSPTLRRPPSPPPAPPPRLRVAAPVPPELLAMVSKVGASPLKPTGLPPSSTSSSSRPTHTTPGPSTPTTTTTPEEAKRRLAEWAREHEKRGPP